MDFVRGVLRLLAVLVAATPFVLAVVVVFSRTMSFSYFPGSYWILLAIFVVPVALGFFMWRLASLGR